jgi:hypothetical protein
MTGENLKLELLMDENALLTNVTTAIDSFGAKCKKFAGAVTIELLKVCLQRNGIQTSARDIYIEKVPLEIDLLIPKPGAVARYGILYRAEDVLVAFEVKKLGSFGGETINETRRDFELICAANPSIRCAYVTLTERLGFKHALTDENLKHRAFTFFWHRGSKDLTYQASGDFEKLVRWLQLAPKQQPTSEATA